MSVVIIVAIIALGQGLLLSQLSWWGVMVVTACITAIRGGVWSRGDGHAGGGRRVINVDDIR